MKIRRRKRLAFCVSIIIWPCPEISLWRLFWYMNVCVSAWKKHFSYLKNQHKSQLPASAFFIHYFFVDFSKLKWPFRIVQKLTEVKTVIIRGITFRMV